VRSDCFLPQFLDMLYVCMLALDVRWFT
jgi:hypothetical protein